jgi:hypothetical protein
VDVVRRRLLGGGEGLAGLHLRTGLVSRSKQALCCADNKLYVALYAALQKSSMWRYKQALCCAANRLYVTL